MTPEQINEEKAKVLESMREKIVIEIGKGVNQALGELNDYVRNRIKSNVPALLGFRTFGNRWDIDPFDKERGVAADYISQRTKDLIIEELFKKHKESMIAQFESNFRDRMQRIMWEKSEETAKIIGKKHIDNILSDEYNKIASACADKLMHEFLPDPADPHSGDTKFGEIVLKGIAAKIATT